MLLSEPKREFKSMHADLAASQASQHDAMFGISVQRRVRSWTARPSGIQHTVQQQRHNITHPEVVVAYPGMLVVIIADALPAGQQQLLVC